jgi:hypothetical protein
VSRNRSGALALAAAGILFLLYPVVRPWHDENTVAGATTSMASTAWVAAHFFAMVGFILLPLGLLALRGAAAGRVAAAAVAVTWVGAGLCLPYYGAEDFGLHAIADRHVGGLLDVVRAVRFQPLAITVFGAGLIALAAGGVLVAVAVWRSGVLARWVGVPFAAGAVLFLPQFFSPAPVRIAHGVLMAAGLLIMAGGLWSARPVAAGAGRLGGLPLTSGTM